MVRNRHAHGILVSLVVLIGAGMVGVMVPAGGVAAEEAVIYVATDGDDAADGSEATPFATLQRARDAIREMKAGDGLPADGVIVQIGDGRYEVRETLNLTDEDSGTADAPIRYTAAPGAEPVFSGGLRVPTSAFGPVEDTAALGRLPGEARDNVLSADLKALGLEDYGSPGSGGLAVFFGEERMTLARWPNEGFTRIKDVLGIDPKDTRGTKGDKVGIFVYEGDRAERWVGEKDLWVHGYWFWDWSDQRHAVEEIDTEEKTIEVEEPYHGYGYRPGQWYYAYNALSELDQPGEWYLDRQDGVLYFWPEGDIDDRSVTVSAAGEFVVADNVHHVSFEGLKFSASRGTAISLNGGSNNSIIGCTFHGMGGLAARVSGSDHRIANCDAYNLASAGFVISGGDRKTLTPANNVIDNCHIHHYGQWERMYTPAVRIRGVGQTISHCLMHTAPHQAVSFSGNEHLMEFNEIHSVCLESNDAGAIYSGRDWTKRGTVIRNNYFHHINGHEGRGASGVYLDDMFCGTHTIGNVFYRVTRALLIGGGRDNTVINNLFVDCPRTIHLDNRAMGWASYHVDATMTDRLNAVPHKQPPWSERYPELVNILEDEPAVPKGNVVTRNIMVGPYDWDNIHPVAKEHGTVEDNLVLESADFVRTDPAHMELLDNAPGEQIGFEPLPWDQMGLYEDEARPTWPVEHEVAPQVLETWRERQQAKQRRGPRPQYAAAPCEGEVQVNGDLNESEWMGLDRDNAMTIKEGVQGNVTEPPSFAWICYDDEALMVGIDNQVDDSDPVSTGDTWGQDDAVELALKHPEEHIIVLRGFPNGTMQSSGEAGCPENLTSRAAENVEYAARIVDDGRWICEWRIPFASLGIEPDPELRLDFNISVRKMASRLWQMWRGTGAHTWDVDRAGILRFAE